MKTTLFASLLIAIVLALCSPASAQQTICGPNGCYQVPSYSYAAPVYSTPTYSYAEPVASVQPVFNMSRTVNGTYRASNNVNGQQWRWEPFSQSWIYEGNSMQPVVVTQSQPAVITEQRVYASPWRTRTYSRTYYGGGNSNCPCGPACQCGANCRCR